MSRLAVVLCVSLLAACGGSDPNAPATPEGTRPPEPAKTVAPPPQAMPATAEPVDVCSLLAQKDVEAVIGKLMKAPEPEAAQGSLLGGCNYMSESGAFVMVSARPAREFDATVKYTEKKGPYTEVPGLGEKAYRTTAGVMIQPAGEPYFLVVLGAGGSGAVPDQAFEVAKKLKL